MWYFWRTCRKCTSLCKFCPPWSSPRNDAGGRPYSSRCQSENRHAAIVNREFEQDLTTRADTWPECERVIPITYHALGVTVLPTHGQVEPEEIAINHINVAGLRTAESVNPTIKRLVRTNLDGNSRVFTVHRYCNNILRSVIFRFTITGIAPKNSLSFFNRLIAYSFLS